MIAPLDKKIEATRTHIAFHLDGILKAFKPGVKITVLVRTPGFPERDFVMTDDNPSEAIDMLRRRSAPNTIVVLPEDQRN